MSFPVEYQTLSSQLVFYFVAMSCGYTLILNGKATAALIAGHRSHSSGCYEGYDYNGELVHMPSEVVARQQENIDISSVLWQTVLDNTGQFKNLM